jgi:hypothetical protein
MQNKIIFNGKEYNNLDEMPPDARRAYEAAMGQFNDMFADSDRDGLPDIFENIPSSSVQVFSTSKIFFDGKEYNSVEDMPAEARQKYEQAFEDKNRDGIPDAFENLGQGNVLVSSQQATPNTPLPPTAVHTTVGFSPNILLIIAGVIIVFLLVVVAALVLVLLF